MMKVGSKTIGYSDQLTAAIGQRHGELYSSLPPGGTHEQRTTMAMLMVLVECFVNVRMALHHMSLGDLFDGILQGATAKFREQWPHMVKDLQAQQGKPPPS